jgi:hypothetical protein
MKKLLLFPLVLFPFLLFAQASFYKEFTNSETCKYEIDKVLELKNGNLLLVANKTYCQDAASSTTNFITLDAKGKELAQTKFERDSKFIDIILDIIPLGNGYFAIGKTYDKKELTIKMVFYKLDANLKIIDSKVVQPDKNFEYVEFYDVKLYLDGNYTYFSTTYQYGLQAFSPAIAVAGRINIDFSNLIINTFAAETKGAEKGGLDITKRLGAKGFLVDNYTSILTLDEDLNLEKEQDAEFEDFDQRREIYKNKYMTIAQHTLDEKPNDPNSPLKFDIGIKILDAKLKLEKIALIGKSIAQGALRDTYDLPGKRGLNWKDPNKIYVSGLTYREFKFGSNLVNDAWINISRLDSNLAVKWTKYFWAEGFNETSGVLATDDGVLVYGSRDSLKTGISNAFVMKLSENGLLKDEDLDDFSNTNIKIGPNPFKSYCTFAIDAMGENKTMELEIFNVLGQKEYAQNISEGLNDVDLSNLPSGNYFYNIRIENKLAKYGKLTKL